MCRIATRSGCSSSGWLASGRPLRTVAAAYLGCVAASLLLFGLFANDLRTALPLALAIGAFLFGSMVGLYAATPLRYPAEIRTTGLGWAIGKTGLPSPYADSDYTPTAYLASGVGKIYQYQPDLPGMGPRPHTDEEVKVINAEKRAAREESKRQEWNRAQAKIRMTDAHRREEEDKKTCIYNDKQMSLINEPPPFARPGMR